MINEIIFLVLYADHIYDIKTGKWLFNYESCIAYPTKYTLD